MSGAPSLGLWRGLAVAWCALLVGCPAAGPAPSVEPVPVKAPVPDPAPGPAVEEAEGGPPLVVKPKGLSDLYEGFFRDGDALTAFSRRLGNTLSHDRPVTIEVAWTEAKLTGVITLLVPDADPVGFAVAEQIVKGGPVDPAPIQPLVGSVGAWRAEMGERFDLRLLSFETHTVFWDHKTGGRCWMKGPLNDPAGTALAPCFSCMIPGGGVEQICRDGDSWPAPLKGSPRAISILGSALAPGT